MQNLNITRFSNFLLIQTYCIKIIEITNYKYYKIFNFLSQLSIYFLVDPNSGTIHQHVITEPAQQQPGQAHTQNAGASSLSSSHCISCHSPLTPSNLRRDGGTLAMCDTCAKYTNMNGIRGGPVGTQTLVGVRSSGSNRRVSSSVRY